MTSSNHTSLWVFGTSSYCGLLGYSTIYSGSGYQCLGWMYCLHHQGEDRGIVFFWNVGNHLQGYMVS